MIEKSVDKDFRPWLCKGHLKRTTESLIHEALNSHIIVDR